MQDNICPFSAPIAQDAFQCSNAQKIIRRGGEEIACTTNDYQQCSSIQEHCRLAALREMGLEDDLLSVPHATLVKTQYGTLLGLGKHYAPDQSDALTILNAVTQQYPNTSEIPTEQTTTETVDFKLQRRRRR